MVNTRKDMDERGTQYRLIPGAKGLDESQAAKKKTREKNKGKQGGKTIEELSEVVDQGAINEQWMDVAFTGEPIRECLRVASGTFCLVARIGIGYGSS
jgi:hypothetical protein